MGFTSRKHQVLKVRIQERSLMIGRSRRRVVIVEQEWSIFYNKGLLWRRRTSLEPNSTWRKGIPHIQTTGSLTVSLFQSNGIKYYVIGEILVKVTDQKHRPNKRIRFIYKRKLRELV